MKETELQIFNAGGMTPKEQEEYKNKVWNYCKQLQIIIMNESRNKPIHITDNIENLFVKSLDLSSCSEMLQADACIAESSIFTHELRGGRKYHNPVYIHIDTTNENSRNDAETITKILTGAGVSVHLIDTGKPMTAADYLQAGFYDFDIDYLKQYENRKMGLHPDIDKYLSLFPGLAVLGGQASLGKTTFSINIACKLLEKKEHILYFALEQRPDELITKIIARHIFEKNPDTYIDNSKLNKGNREQEVKEALEELPKTLENFHIINCDFETTVNGIIKTVDNYMIRNPEIKPIVIIDYLQIIAPPADYRGSSKTEYIDENLKALKKWQKNAGLFVLVISSFNRANNYKPVSYESFLYTSAIEYTCDFVWGLQLQLLDPDRNEDFYIKKGKQGGEYSQTDAEQRRMMQEAQTQTPKKIQFVSLKNRKGRQLFKANFDYYPAHDFVKPDYSNIYGKINPYSDIMDTLKNNKK